MRIQSSDKLNSSKQIFDDPRIFAGARLILDGDTDTLIVYDCESGPNRKVVAYLDKDVPFVLFRQGVPCSYGIYAFLPSGGEYIVYHG